MPLFGFCSAYPAASMEGCSSLSELARSLHLDSDLVFLIEVLILQLYVYDNAAFNTVNC